MASSKYQMDMCRGSLPGKMLLFTLPLMLSSCLQLAFHAVDMIVIGQYAPHESLAGVGCSGSITGLLINTFCGLSVGTNVLTARYFGAKDPKKIRHCVHSSMALAFYGGILLLILGEIIALPMLQLQGTPEDVMPEAYTYLWITFLAIPFILFFNFGYAVLRAVGDTLRPMYFLIAAGAVNAGLNLFLVIVCGMRASGVALATLISHIVSAYLMLNALQNSSGATRFMWHYMKVEWRVCCELLKIGIPAAIQSSCYSVSNLIIMAGINSFGSLAVAGNAAAGTIEGFVAISSGAFHQTALAFAAQNHGGKQLMRIKKSIFYAAGFAAGIEFVTGFALLGYGRSLLRIVSTDAQVIEWGLRRMAVMFTTYAFGGIMDSLTGSLRGLGHSMMATTATLCGICGFRVVWVLWIFPMNRTFTMLFLSYPISWSAVAAFSGFFLYRIWKKELLPLKKVWANR